jgi:hypothetical protein
VKTVWQFVDLPRIHAAIVNYLLAYHLLPVDQAEDLAAMSAVSFRCVAEGGD